MKKNVILMLCLVILMSGVVSAYSHCVDDGDSEICCSKSSHVFCDNTLDVCGTRDWCYNYARNNEKSCQPNDDWCCDDRGYILDYNADVCCPKDYPFYSSSAGGCLDVNTVGANNYYTSRQNCDYINDVANKVFIIDDKCVGSNYVACKQNEASSFIADFFNNGQIVGKCGVECIEDTDCNQDVQDVRYGCDKKDSLNIVEKNVCLNNICSFKTDIDNIGKILGKCGVECLTDTNCNDDFVNETCEDMNSVDVLINNFCSDENVCSFSVSKTDNGIILDKCNVECLANIDCVSYCGDKQPTCDTGICGCSYQIDSTNYIKIFLLEYKYIAMFVAFLIVGIYAITRKTKKRGKKRRS